MGGKGKDSGTKFRIRPELLEHINKVRDEFALPDRTAALNYIVQAREEASVR